MCDGYGILSALRNTFLITVDFGTNEALLSTGQCTMDGIPIVIRLYNL